MNIFNGLEYKISENNLISIIKCTNTDTHIDIPSEINGFPVVCINDYAFKDCVSLEGINIPNSIIHIGGCAFQNTALYNNKDNWNDGVLYINDCLIAAKEDIKGSYSVKNGTRLIAAYAFKNCSTLEGLIIPESVMDIGGFALDGCTSLKEIILPHSVKRIGSSAFSSYPSLINIIIPDSVTSIGNFAFESCTSLETIAIPDSVTSISDYAFENCVSLKNICGVSGSYAEKYAKDHDISFISGKFINGKFRPSEIIS